MLSYKEKQQTETRYFNVMGLVGGESVLGVRPVADPGFESISCLSLLCFGPFLENQTLFSNLGLGVLSPLLTDQTKQGIGVTQSTLSVCTRVLQFSCCPHQLRFLVVPRLHGGILRDRNYIMFTVSHSYRQLGSKKPDSVHLTTSHLLLFFLNLILVHKRMHVCVPVRGGLSPSTVGSRD